MRTELDYPWDTLEEEIPELFNDLTSRISNNLAEFKRTVQIHNEASTMANGIEARVRDVAYMLDTTQRAFAHDMKTIRRNASEHNYSSYALKGMVPAYRTASQITGLSQPFRVPLPTSFQLSHDMKDPNKISVVSQVLAEQPANSGQSRTASPTATSFP